MGIIYSNLQQFKLPPQYKELIQSPNMFQSVLDHTKLRRYQAQISAYSDLVYQSETSIFRKCNNDYIIGPKYFSTTSPHLCDIKYQISYYMEVYNFRLSDIQSYKSFLDCYNNLLSTLSGAQILKNKFGNFKLTPDMIFFCPNGIKLWISEDIVKNRLEPQLIVESQHQMVIEIIAIFDAKLSSIYKTRFFQKILNKQFSSTFIIGAISRFLIQNKNQIIKQYQQYTKQMDSMTPPKLKNKKISIRNIYRNQSFKQKKTSISINAKKQRNLYESFLFNSVTQNSFSKDGKKEMPISSTLQNTIKSSIKTYHTYQPQQQYRNTLYLSNYTYQSSGVREIDKQNLQFYDRQMPLYKTKYIKNAIQNFTETPKICIKHQNSIQKYQENNKQNLSEPFSRFHKQRSITAFGQFQPKYQLQQKILKKNQNIDNQLQKQHENSIDQRVIQQCSGNQLSSQSLNSSKSKMISVKQMKHFDKIKQSEKLIQIQKKSLLNKEKYNGRSNRPSIQLDERFSRRVNRLISINQPKQASMQFLKGGFNQQNKKHLVKAVQTYQSIPFSSEAVMSYADMDYMF